MGVEKQEHLDIIDKKCLKKASNNDLEGITGGPKRVV